MKAMQISEYGGPDALTLHDLALRKPASGQVRVRIMMAGVNFVDINHCNGKHPQRLPFVPGVEGAGIVDEVGEGVHEVAPEDRVAFLSLEEPPKYDPGAYAEACLVSAKDLVRLPDSMSFEQGAAVLAQGITAQYLIKEARQIKAGETVLVHAATGGVSMLLVQWARHLGAHVIGTVSTEQKARVAREAGAHDVIISTEQNFVTEVQRITNGQGAHLILDAVGKDTFPGDLEAVARRGNIFLYGSNSGPIEPFAPGILQRRALTVSGGSIINFVQSREEFLGRANDVFSAVQEGWLKSRIQVLPLLRAADALRLLESRKSMGKVVLSTQSA
jgi:NADPH2:quinone reductase